MKRNLFFILFALFCLNVFPQQVPQFSQNMFNKLANNPGFAGSRDAISTTVLQRSQWMGFGEDPTRTLNLSADAPISLIHGGVGLNISSDQIAQYNNLHLQASYAYTSDLGPGQLGVGISFGIFQSGFDASKVKAADQNDPAIPPSTSGSVFDIGGGLYYNTEDVYLGISSAHITEPTVEYDNGSDFSLERHYFLIAGYYYFINPNLSLNPSIYLKSDGATSQLDINSNLIYDNKIWGGLSYRHGESKNENGDISIRPEIVVLTGMNITSDLKFGIAYDIVTSGIKNNSLEFMLGYDFKIKTDKDPTRYKNPRFL
tara:strand:+ start:8738 stop:9682 length:945 start_codon:yes stop_codon:yes gene_type:complete